MIVVAFLLVLAGLGLFVAGVLTGVTALYWACVAACVVAAGVIFAARRGLEDDPVPPSAAARRPAEVDRAAAGPPPTTGTTTTETGTGTTAPAPEEPATGAHAAPVADAAAAPVGPDGEPPLEEVEVTDLLLVVDLTDEVLVVDEHPRYHLDGCPHLAGATPIPLPLDEARTDGFTPCGTCRPDRHLADRARGRG